MRVSVMGTKSAAAAAVLAIVLTACGGGEKNAADTTSAAVAAAASAAAAAVPAAAPAGALPSGATMGMVAEGDSIFHGQAAGGLCFTCHGMDAKGTPLAPSLADTVWLTGDGSYAFIQKRVIDGMPKPAAPYVAPMPPMGGAKLTPDQVKAVSAYVYSISHTGA
ncbi:MAG TPA: c-type cytochrome [Gemmatimonadaceae bacterium]|nr:c-type cytochrome [Gemmatimonadaceae bacterium]